MMEKLPLTLIVQPRFEDSATGMHAYPFLLGVCFSNPLRGPTECFWGICNVHNGGKSMISWTA